MVGRVDYTHSKYNANLPIVGNLWLTVDDGIRERKVRWFVTGLSEDQGPENGRFPGTWK